MIYFNEDLVAKALKEAHEMRDVKTDIDRIDSLVNSVWTPTILQLAYQLDTELRNKYKMIDFMFSIVNNMPKKVAYNNYGQSNSRPAEIEAIWQDRFGIFADVLLKKGVIKDIKEFIKDILSD